MGAKREEGVANDVTLNQEAWAVLEALALGLRLQETPAEWTFVGDRQVPEQSGVSSAAMADLLRAGFVVGSASCAKATQAGLAACHGRALAIWDAACRLATQYGLRSDTCWIISKRCSDRIFKYGS